MKIEFDDEEIKEKETNFCWTRSKHEIDPSIPDVMRKASWWGEKAKSVAGALWQWIERINSFNRLFHKDNKPSVDVVPIISLCGDHFIDVIGQISNEQGFI